MHGAGGLWYAETGDDSTGGKIMNTIIKFVCLIGFVCAMAMPVFAGEEKVMIMLGGKTAMPIWVMSRMR